DDEKSATLANVVDRSIGRGIRSGSDDAYFRPRSWSRRQPASIPVNPVLEGEQVRDFQERVGDDVLYPYVEGRATQDVLADVLWPLKRFLAKRGTFKGDMGNSGRMWWEYMQHTQSAYDTPLSITFAEVATHNHFVLDRVG